MACLCVVAIEQLGTACLVPHPPTHNRITKPDPNIMTGCTEAKEQEQKVTLVQPWPSHLHVMEITANKQNAVRHIASSCLCTHATEGLCASRRESKGKKDDPNRQNDPDTIDDEFALVAKQKAKKKERKKVMPFAMILCRPRCCTQHTLMIPCCTQSAPISFWSDL